MITAIDCIIIKEWLIECGLDHSDEEFNDLMDRFTPRKSLMKLHKPTLDVLDLEAEFLNSDGSEPEMILDADSEEAALVIGRFFCRENNLEPSGDVLLLCVRRLREQL